MNRFCGHFQLASYKNNDGETVNFLSNLNDLYNWNYNFISQLDNTKEAALKYLADSITTNAGSQREKAQKIYQWVQSNIKYIAFEDWLEGFVPRRAIDVYTHRFGDERIWQVY